MKRELTGGLALAVKIVGFLFALVYFYISGFALPFKATELTRGLYLLFNFVLGFLMYAPTKKTVKSKVFLVGDILLAIISVICIVYWIVDYSNYAYNRVGRINNYDIVFGVIMMILAIELCRRSMGNILAVLGVIFVLVCYFGPYLPGMLAHKGFSWLRIIEFNFNTMDGLFGSITSTFATYVMPFMVFGAILQHSGGGQFFVDLSKSLCGNIPGGASVITIWCCALFGMISGSPVACAMSVGAFCIPMMLESGYDKETSAAVTASAATGGQFMPPVMGAGAFLLSTLTEVPYSKIIVMAIVPALLYYLSLTMQTFFTAKRDGLKPVPVEERTNLKDVMKNGWYYVLVLVGATVFIAMGYSVGRMAFFATLFLLVVSFFHKETAMTPKRFFNAMSEAGTGSVVVGATAGVLGLIMGGITLTGIGVKFSAALVQIAHGNIFISIILVALIAMIIGMGVPTTASYIVMAILAAPALTRLGLPNVYAHLLCFWLCMTANVTPPVCVAAFSAASVAKADPMRTGWRACIVSIFLYLMPFCFAYTPQITILGYPLLSVLEIILSWVIITIALAAAMQGWYFRKLNVVERILFAVFIVPLIVPNYLFDIVGIVAFLALSFFVYRSRGKATPAAA